MYILTTDNQLREVELFTCVRGTELQLILITKQEVDNFCTTEVRTKQYDKYVVSELLPALIKGGKLYDNLEYANHSWPKDRNRVVERDEYRVRGNHEF